MERKYDEYAERKEKIQAAVMSKDENFVYNYHLCGELIHENDMKICRRKIKTQYVDDLYLILNQCRDI